MDAPALGDWSQVISQQGKGLPAPVKQQGTCCVLPSNPEQGINTPQTHEDKGSRGQQQRGVHKVYRVRNSRAIRKPRAVGGPGAVGLAPGGWSAPRSQGGAGSAGIWLSHRSSCPQAPSQALPR